MDLFEEPHSHILFIPEVFISDCLDDDTNDFDKNINTQISNLSNIQPEDIDLISPDQISVSSSDDEEIDDEMSDIDDIFSKNSAELDDMDNYIKNIKNTHKGLELNELLSQTEFIKSSGENSDIKYDSIPKYFINTRNWPKTTNLLCCYCHEKISGAPFPIALSKTKILVPENEDSTETFISLITSDKTIDKNLSETYKSAYGEMPEYTDKASDEHLLYSSQILKEVKAFRLHDIAGHDIVCVGNYIRKVNDPKIINKRESLQMSITIGNEITGEKIEDIPDKDLWIVMEQYCGSSGQKRSEYREKNLDKEIKLKQAMKINN